MCLFSIIVKFSVYNFIKKYTSDEDFYFFTEVYQALGSGVNDVGVQVPSAAPNSKNPNLVPVGNGFGFLIYLDYPNFNNKLEKQ